MSDFLAQLYSVLVDVVLPNLKGIQASQTEQRMQTDRLNQSLDEFRAEMQIRFAELRAEVIFCRQELEDAMVTLRESDTSGTGDENLRGKKTLIH
jgi:hypothetical protein